MQQASKHRAVVEEPATDKVSTDFSALLNQAHQVGRETITAAAASVDRDARFPTEGIGALKDLKLLSIISMVIQWGPGVCTEYQINSHCMSLFQRC